MNGIFYTGLAGDADELGEMMTTDAATAKEAKAAYREFANGQIAHYRKGHFARSRTVEKVPNLYALYFFAESIALHLVEHGYLPGGGTFLRRDDKQLVLKGVNLKDGTFNVGLRGNETVKVYIARDDDGNWTASAARTPTFTLK